jgi:hypothetical protein
MKIDFNNNESRTVYKDLRLIISSITPKVNQTRLNIYVSNFLYKKNEIEGLEYDSSKSFIENVTYVGMQIYEKCKHSAHSPWLKELSDSLIENYLQIPLPNLWIPNPMV